MKLKMIHIAQDRVLDSNSMKFVIGGNDDIIDGGWLPEVNVYGTDKSSCHSSHDGSFTDCEECKRIIQSLQGAGDKATGTNWMDNEYIYNMQLFLTYGVFIYHYINQW